MQYIPWIISALSLLVAAMTYHRNGEKDERGAMDGIRESLLKANMKLDQVCATTNETRSDIKAVNKDLTALDGRIIALERDMKTAFNAIDELKGEHKHD